MTKIHEGLADTGFPVPSSVTTAQICRKSESFCVGIPGVCENDPRETPFTPSTSQRELFQQRSATIIQLTVCSESGGLATEYCPEKNTRTFAGDSGRRIRRNR